MEPTEHQKQLAAYVLNEMVAGTRDIILTGGAGTGKTVTSAYIHSQVKEINQLVGTNLSLKLTATTNEASDVLAVASQQQVPTIYKALGLFPQGGKIHCRNSSSLFNKAQFENLIEKRLNSTNVPEKYFLVDEYSYISEELLFWIMLLLPNAGIIYVGDADQLLSPSIKGTRSPVEVLNPTVFELTEKKRSIALADGSDPIGDLAECFRKAIHTGEIPKVDLDENIHLIENEDEFLQLIRDSSREDSRTIAYTNSRVSELAAVAYPVGTVHKAQGKSAGTIFMDLKNMTKCIHTSGISTFNRLMYVGISRARRQLYIYYED